MLLTRTVLLYELWALLSHTNEKNCNVLVRKIIQAALNVEFESEMPWDASPNFLGTIKIYSNSTAFIADEDTEAGMTKFR